jgi:nitrous oxidase accessory protein NosD
MKTFMEIRPNATLTSLVLGLAAAASAIAADLKVPADYPTIQAAVNAAHTNDTIQIAPGVYTNQVQIISKQLTLIGQPGTLLRATETMTSPPDSIQFPIIHIRFSQVTVRGLTFEGERLAGRFVGRGELLGIDLRQSSGNVENCAFYGFRESTPGLELADAIFVFNSEGAAAEVNVRVVGSTFADNNGGIWFLGSPTKKSINVTVENNTFVGPPVNGIEGNYGILIREGVGGRIAGNTISGFSYVGTGADFPISWGILADNTANYPPVFGILQHLEIEGNTLRDNQEHISLIKGDGSVVRNNRFQGTAPGIVPIGLVVSGTNVTIANNQFEDMPEGIRLLGDDPIPGFGLGDILGFAVNAQVTSNRFCNVTTPINRQPPATVTETGTLTNSCSSNALTIASAVFVSWPAEDDRWVESATSVVGPWTPYDATTFLQRGRRSIAVPTDDAHRFFRLR